MKMIEAILTTLEPGVVVDVRIGLRWTAVVAEVAGERRCGLAATLTGEPQLEGRPSIPDAGRLADFPAADLAALALGSPSELSSVGIAALNALLPRQPQSWQEINAETLISERGAGKNVVLVGHFPFVDRLRAAVGNLVVLEQAPRDGDLPASAASRVLPGADLVAITGMAIVNHTLHDLLAMCSPQVLTLVLGPSTPLSPVLFSAGVDVVCGAIVTDCDAVLRTVCQGGNFRQVHRAGTRLVAIEKPTGPSAV